MPLQRGFKKIWYHFYVTRDGMLHHTHPMKEACAHTLGFICIVWQFAMKAGWTKMASRRIHGRRNKKKRCCGYWEN